jgi:hypothetical protein
MITWLVSRSLFDAVGGFDEALMLREDLDLAFRLAEAADAVALPERLAFVREHSGRKTKAAVDQQLKTALIFGRAARRAGRRTVKRIARRQCARSLAAAARASFRQGRILSGLALAGRSLLA